jgi:NADH-quinone oxidoreductase subunit J
MGIAKAMPSASAIWWKSFRRRAGDPPDNWNDDWNDDHRTEAIGANPATNDGGGSDGFMSPVAAPFFFYLLSSLAVVGGLLVITRRNPLHSALGLIVTLLALAGLYLMLYAPFVAAVQIVVEAGGIMLLFFSVIMLVNAQRASIERPSIELPSIERPNKELPSKERPSKARPNKARRFNRLWPLGLAIACALLALFVSAFVKGKALFPDRMMALSPSSNTQQIASLLYGDAGKLGQYTFVFEIASLLFLAAIVGAVIMTRKRM